MKSLNVVTDLAALPNASTVCWPATLAAF